MPLLLFLLACGPSHRFDGWFFDDEAALQAGGPSGEGDRRFVDRFIDRSRYDVAARKGRTTLVVGDGRWRQGAGCTVPECDNSLVFEYLGEVRQPVWGGWTIRERSGDNLEIDVVGWYGDIGVGGTFQVANAPGEPDSGGRDTGTRSTTTPTGGGTTTDPTRGVVSCTGELEVTFQCTEIPADSTEAAKDAFTEQCRGEGNIVGDGCPRGGLFAACNSVATEVRGEPLVADILYYDGFCDVYYWLDLEASCDQNGGRYDGPAGACG
ncbi:MAG: hypothetical protein ACI8PZ_007020 [Myxococcota bacterium]|jgi:hypothetical protein